MLKDTIISAFNYDGTLLKWLKKVEDALQNASASEFRVNKKGNATISFSIVFANGDTLESGDIILQQGESVTGATIRQGHLILTLSNGNELDAGDIGAVTGFSINASQHLIVTYQNGNTQDLGAIFNGATIKVNTLTSDNPEISTLKPIVELMEGYSFTPRASTENYTISPIYAGVCKNGNKVTFAYSLNLGILTNTAYGQLNIGSFGVPTALYNRLVETTIGYANVLSISKLVCFRGSLSVTTEIVGYTQKLNGTVSIGIDNRNGTLSTGNEYYLRYEVTFLLSDNLAG